MVVRAALRFGFGTASLLAGSWVLRALHGAPAALGASPAEIEAVARRSPHFRDGVVRQRRPGVRYQPRPRRAAEDHLGLDRLARRVAARRTDPGGRARVRRPRRDAVFRVCWFGHSSALIEVDGYRVLADPDLESPLLAVTNGGPRADA